MYAILSIVFVPLSLLCAAAARKWFGISFGLAMLAISAGLLYSYPWSLASGAESPATLVSFRLYGAMLLLSAGLVVRDVRRGAVSFRRPMAPPALMLLAGIPALLAIQGMVVGLWRENDLVLVLGDSLRLGLASTAVVFGWRLRLREAWVVAVIVSLVALSADLLSLVRYGAAYAIQGAGLIRAGGGYGAALALGVVMLIFAWPRVSRDPQLSSEVRSPRSPTAPLEWVSAASAQVMSVRVSARARKRRRLGLGIAIVVIDVCAAALSLFRTLWVAVPLALLIVVLISVFVWRRYDFARRLAVVALIAIAIGAFFAGTRPGEFVVDRVVNTLERGTADASLKIRAIEGDLVSAELDKIWGGNAVGAGAGATFVFLAKDTDTWHQVHNSFLNFKFRTGHIGLALYVIWLATAVLVSLGGLRIETPLSVWAGVVIVIGVIQSLTAFRFIGLGVPGFALGVALQIVVDSSSRRKRPHLEHVT